MTSPEAAALQTEIRTLGPCKLDSALPYRTWADDKIVRIFVDEELSDEAATPFGVCLEAAGPRKKLYFDPTRAKCAIVTCGGLCPGINDVIRAIVMEAFHAYHVPSVLGIPYGLEGFIPNYGHTPLELTPAVVADIHRFGGTMLGSSRGPQAPEEIVDTLERSNVNALFVIGGDGTLLGIVTVDDVMNVAEQESTEDFQKFGGTEGLDLSYTRTPLAEMVRKRAGWLVILFFGEMLTASAMGYFDDEIARAVVLALFVPLIISSGGNSGSQAASLIIRSLALGELKLRNWWYVMRKEIFSGLILGAILGIIGFVRIFIWQEAGLYDYGTHWPWIAASVSVSLVFIVLWGTLSGSMIPFILKKCGLDPATASAPFVATLVDVTGLIIYFSIAALFLTGKIL